MVWENPWDSYADYDEEPEYEELPDSDYSIKYETKKAALFKCHSTGQVAWIPKAAFRTYTDWYTARVTYLVEEWFHICWTADQPQSARYVQPIEGEFDGF